MTIRDIFQTYGMAYLNKYTDTIPDNHRKVIHDIMDCRTERMGTILCTVTGTARHVKEKRLMIGFLNDWIRCYRFITS